MSVSVHSISIRFLPYPVVPPLVVKRERSWRKHLREHSDIYTLYWGDDDS